MEVSLKHTSEELESNHRILVETRTAYNKDAVTDKMGYIKDKLEHR